MSEVIDISYLVRPVLREAESGLSLRDALDMGAQVLEDAGLESAGLDARILLMEATGLSLEVMLASPAKTLGEEEINNYLQLVTRRVQHEPIAYITGKKSFWSLDFHVTCDTLIPRPDSETLIELCLKLIKDRSKPSHIVDLGTGSGCLLLSLLSELPQARGTGIDVSERALEIAARNANALGFSRRAKFIPSRWCENLVEKADVIISNPPYIAAHDMAGLAKTVAAFEPKSALTDGGDGLSAYREIAKTAGQHLNPNGFCVVEMGFGQSKDVQAIFRAEGWKMIKVERDLAGVERALAVSRQ